ncbi:hypothetical protein CSPX01_08390 [Colletotrichum filicis]|nr:hypothetical protein CSPX01_08390 [Colletotrichum filicis]
MYSQLSAFDKGWVQLSRLSSFLFLPSSSRSRAGRTGRHLWKVVGADSVCRDGLWQLDKSTAGPRILDGH